MKEMLNNADWFMIASIIGSIAAIIFSYLNYLNLKKADSALIKLIRENDQESKKFIEEINKIFNEYNAKAEEFNKFNDEPNFKAELLKNQEKLLNLDLGTLQLKFVNDLFDRESPDKLQDIRNKIEILDTIQRSSFKGKFSYWNEILSKSGLEKINKTAV